MQLKTSEVNIEVGNGGRLETDGTVYLPFTLSDYEFHHVFFVCKDSSTAILGNDFIVRNKIHLFMAEGWMNYAGNDIPLFTRHGARQVRKVYLAKTVMIPPMQEVEVPTYMKNYISTSRPRMFEPQEDLLFSANVLAPRMLLDARDSRPRIRLFNPGEAAVQVNIHRCLGTTDDADDVKSVFCASHQSDEAYEYEDEEELDGKHARSPATSVEREQPLSLQETYEIGRAHV